MRTNILKAVSVAAFVFAASAYAQVTARVPFIVNVDAIVTAEQGTESVSMLVTANVETILEIPLGGVSVSYYGGARGANAPTITGSRGNITLRLPAQSYQNAEVALYSINGKRVLHGKAAASETASAISRRNVAAGVYLLSVKGINGSAFSTRLNHGGGNININAAFGNETAAHEKPLAKQAAAGNWEITVSAVEEGYGDFTYTLNVVAGNNPVQDIILFSAYGTFTDDRDGKTYKYVILGEKTWMAENLNYDDAGSKCYNGTASNCNTYGRLYKWDNIMYGQSSSETHGVKGICPSGWHIPSIAEWEMLYFDKAGKYLKAASGWDSYEGKSGNGTDDFGFSALPGGYAGSSSSYNIGKTARWWTCTEANASYAYYWSMSYNSDELSRYQNYKTEFYSLRCVKN